MLIRSIACHPKRSSARWHAAKGLAGGGWCQCVCVCVHVSVRFNSRCVWESIARVKVGHSALESSLENHHALGFNPFHTCCLPLLASPGWWMMMVIEGPKPSPEWDCLVSTTAVSFGTRKKTQAECRPKQEMCYGEKSNVNLSSFCWIDQDRMIHLNFCNITQDI